MEAINQAIQWYLNEQARGITYSMDNRFGPNSFDCSSAGYYALRGAGMLPANIAIGSTDSMFGDFERNGWVKLQPNEQGNFDTKRGDAVIWGHRGASAGAFGHFMLFTSADDVIHCSYGYNGIHTDNYDQLRAWNSYPEQTFYRYTGQTKVPSANATDQIVEVGSTIRFDKTYMVNDVQLIGGIWQVRTNELCKSDFTWDDNGIPANPLVEIDGQGYATADQSLDVGSHYKFPGKYQVLDVGPYANGYLAQISYNGLKFWVDIETATEIKSSDPGTSVPGKKPVAPPPVQTPPETPENPPVTPEAPVEPPVTNPDPEPATPPEDNQPTPPTNNPKEDNDVAISPEDQEKLKIQTERVQAVADDVAADEDVQALVGTVSAKTKLRVYIVGDALIGLGLVTPNLAIVLGWGDIVRVVAASSMFAAAGGFVLTMFGIYKNGKKSE